jgi:hypothetical protein
MSRISVTCLCVYVIMAAIAAAVAMPVIAATAAFIAWAHASAIMYQKFRLGHVLYHVLESLAHKLDFVPVQSSNRLKDAEETFPS